jgi:hypothetical protein
MSRILKCKCLNVKSDNKMLKSKIIKLLKVQNAKMFKVQNNQMIDTKFQNVKCKKC